MEINFIKYHPDKQLDPLFERFLLWSSHILPYNKEEVIKKCEALQKIRNKFRENYTEHKNGLIDVLNKINQSLMKLLNDEQLITIFNKQLKQLSKINKVPFEIIEDFDELYKKNHELYDNLPSYQKEKFLFNNLNKQILKYFGLYKSIKERKINNAIDERLRDYKLIKDKELKRKNDEREEKDKELQEQNKKPKQELIITTSSASDKTKINNFTKLNDMFIKAKQNEGPASIMNKMDFGKLKRDPEAINKFLSALAEVDNYIKNGQSNITNLDNTDMVNLRVKLYKANSKIDELKIKYKAQIDKKEEEEKPTSSSPVKETEEKKEQEKIKVIEQPQSNEVIKTMQTEKSTLEKIISQLKPEDVKLIKNTNKNEFFKKSQQSNYKTKIINKFKKSIPEEELKKLTKEDFNLIYETLQQNKIPSLPDVPTLPPQSDPQMEELEERFKKLKTFDQPQPIQPGQQTTEEILNGPSQLLEDDIEGHGILGAIVNGIKGLFGFGPQVLDDKVIEELLKFTKEKDGNKIIDGIIMYELNKNHPKFKNQYITILKEFDKKHRPKLFKMRNNFKQYDKLEDKYNGSFAPALLGLIPMGINAVSGLINAIRGKGTLDLKDAVNILPGDNRIKIGSNTNDLSGSGLLSGIIGAVKGLFGLGPNVLNDKAIEELLKFTKEKDGNKIIDGIILYIINKDYPKYKNKYIEILKDFDKQHRPKLYFVRNKYKHYNKLEDKYNGSFAPALLGLIPAGISAVSSLINAIRGKGCGTMKIPMDGGKKSLGPNHYKGGKSMTLQDLNNIKQNIKN